MKYSKILLNKATYEFLEFHIDFLIKRGLVPKFVTDLSGIRRYRVRDNTPLTYGIPCVVHKQERVELTISTEFKNLIHSTMRRERINLYEAIYLTVMELTFTPEE